MFRSTDYGLTEKDRQLKAPIVKDKARMTLKKKDVLDKSLRDARKHPEKIAVIRRDMVESVYGKPPYDKKTFTSIKNYAKKFDIHMQYGQSHEIDSLIDAGSNNDYKVALLKKYQKEMDKESFVRMVNIALNYKIISKDVIKGLSR